MKVLSDATDAVNRLIKENVTESSLPSDTRVCFGRCRQLIHLGKQKYAMTRSLGGPLGPNLDLTLGNVTGMIRASLMHSFSWGTNV